MSTRRTPKRPWRLVKGRIGLTVDVWSTYSTKERALAALVEHRQALKRYGGNPYSLYVMDPAGNRVEEGA